MEKHGRIDLVQKRDSWGGGGVMNAVMNPRVPWGGEFLD